jgi:hypothetical protein
MSRKHSTHAAVISRDESEDVEFENVQYSQMPSVDSEVAHGSDQEADSEVSIRFFRS